jgi:alkylation response protein AidB-like acyl-CoA dehydrogenase
VTVERTREPGVGELVVGPTILAHGTPGQRARLLPGIRSGEDVYCLGFSEPGHGSDLASIETRGSVSGGEVVVTGRKAWVFGAGGANAMLVLCRTNLDVPAHLGLSCVMLRLGRDNGVEHRLVREMTGSTHLAEVVLDGARAPLGDVVGGVDGGWATAMTALGHLRAAGFETAHLGLELEFWDLVEEAERSSAAERPEVRADLAWAYSRIALMRFSALRRSARGATEAEAGAEAAAANLAGAEYRRRFGEIALEIAGAAGMVRPDGPGYPTSRWQEVFLSSRAGTIRSGTSEVLRDIVAERILGLPKEAPGGPLWLLRDGRDPVAGDAPRVPSPLRDG